MTFSRKTLRRVLAIVFSAALTFAGVSGHAQEIYGSISGTVTDSSGAIVKGATVTLTNTDQNRVVRAVPTNADGFYVAPSLPLGTYTISVKSKGFKSYAVTGLVLHAKDSLTINGRLIVGSSDQSVTVTADAVQLNLENATTASLINGTQVRELELNTRNYEQLVALQPGVSYGGTIDQIYIGAVVPSGAVSVVSYSVNGQRNSANDWTIDGADNVDRGSNLTLLSFPSIDAIAEFKTIRGTYSAEYGRAASGQINVITRSGTNSLHGSIYEFFRNNVLNANTWSNKGGALGVATPVARPIQRYNDFGGTIGGPVVIPHLYDGRDKTFFFFSEEIRRVHQYAPTTPNVMPLAERTGTMQYAVCTAPQLVGSTITCGASPGSTTVATTSAMARAYMKDIFSTDGSKVSAPNTGSIGLTFNQPLVYNDEQEFIRLDHAFGRKMNVFYRYLHDSLPTQEPNGYGSSGGLPNVQTTSTHSPGTEQLGHVTYIFTPTLLLNAGYAYSSGAILSTPIGSAALANSPDIAGATVLPYNGTTLGVVPNVTFTTYTGVSDGGIYNDHSRNHEIFASLTNIRGKHTFIAGAAYYHYNKTENTQGSQEGTFSFTATTSELPTASQALTGTALATALQEQSVANFLGGYVTGGFSQTPVVFTPNMLTYGFEAYLQDNFKVTPRLTLNMGLRYSFFQQPTDSNHLLSNFDPSTFNPLAAPTVDSAGNLCTTGTCANANGLNTGLPNPIGDLHNGLIYGSASAVGHLSQYAPRTNKADTLDFAPRLGFAYDLFGDGKTSLRGGFGIAFDSGLVGDYEVVIFNNPTPQGLQSASYTFNGTSSFDNPSLGQAGAANTTPPVIYSTSPRYRTPYTEQYSLDVQHQFTHSLLLDVAYVGNKGQHLLGVGDKNSLQPGLARAAGFNPATFTSSTVEKPLNQIRPFRGYNAMDAYETKYSSNYNSLQVQVQKRFRGKSQIDANYTWSRALTNNWSDRSNSPQNYYNPNAEYGRAALDRKHIFSTDFVYETPWFHDQRGLVGHVVGGWEVSGIIQADTGLPFSVSESAGSPFFGGLGTVTDNAGLGILGSSPSGLRPNQVSSPQAGAPHLKTQWFNTSAFVPAGTTANSSSDVPGNAKRGSISGPGFWKVDAALIRNFRLYHDTNLQFRGEGFNIFNHTNYASIAAAATTTTGTSAFGLVTAARDNRYIQVALKLTF